MISTTFDLVRAGIMTAIVGVVPSYEPRSNDLWRPVQQKRDVPSEGLRSFFVELRDITEEGDVYGGCALHTANLSIWTSYQGLTPAEQQVLVGRDQQDLWRALHRAEIDGASKFTKSPFQEENDEDGHIWGAHSFVASIFLALP